MVEAYLLLFVTAGLTTLTDLLLYVQFKRTDMVRLVCGHNARLVELII